MTALLADWPAIPEDMIAHIAGPSSLSQGMPDPIERCPVCRSRDIRYSRHSDGMRCTCMACQKRGKPTEGPPASDHLRGSSPAETMWLRRDEAYRLWNIFANLTRSPAIRQGEGGV